LRFARINAVISGLELELVDSDVLSSVEGPIDAVIANPPYMLDGAGRVYRNGGGALGEALSLRIARESLARLTRGGRLVLYTGAPIVGGHDTLRSALETICRAAKASFDYEELDPDVFGEQLEAPGYEDVERIAAVGLLATVS
jgi:16S rRNA G1207 methylase RsmC